jgi:hypothetical protein
MGRGRGGLFASWRSLTRATARRRYLSTRPPLRRAGPPSPPGHHHRRHHAVSLLECMSDRQNPSFHTPTHPHPPTIHPQSTHTQRNTTQRSALSATAVQADLNDGAYVPAISDVDVPFNYLGTPEQRAARGYTPPANVMNDGSPWTDSSGRDWSFFGWRGRPADTYRGDGTGDNQPATQAAGDSSSLPDFPCAQQAEWGKCGEWWMAGKCDRSCGRCDAGNGACKDVRPNGTVE